MENKLESVVIVRQNEGVGYTATIRFSNPLTDKIVSANTKPAVYSLVKRKVREVLDVQPSDIRFSE